MSAGAASELAYRPVTAAGLSTAADLLSTHLPGCVLSEHLTSGSRVLGAFAGHELVACLHWSPRIALWLGAPVRIGQTGPGATVPGQRGRGIMRELLRGVFGQMKADAIVLAGQETPVIGYHRRTGWEIATFARHHVADRAAVLALEFPGYRCRPACPADAVAVGAVWDENARPRQFSTLRGPGYWRQALTAGRWWVAADEPGRVRGYARGEPASEGIGLSEVVAVDVTAARALLHAFAQASRSATVEWWTAPDDDSRFVFPDPRAVTVTDHVDKLLRVVDAAPVLERLAGARTGWPARAAVRDNVCEWNDRTFPARPAAPDADRSAADPRLDIRALAALATGSISPGSLAAAGLLDPAGAQAAAASGDATSTVPWFPDPL